MKRILLLAAALLPNLSLMARPNNDRSYNDTASFRDNHADENHNGSYEGNNNHRGSNRRHSKYNSMSPKEAVGALVRKCQNHFNKGVDKETYIDRDRRSVSIKEMIRLTDEISNMFQKEAEEIMHYYGGANSEQERTSYKLKSKLQGLQAELEECENDNSTQQNQNSHPNDRPYDMRNLSEQKEEKHDKPIGKKKKKKSRRKGGKRK